MASPTHHNPTTLFPALPSASTGTPPARRPTQTLIALNQPLAAATAFARAFHASRWRIAADAGAARMLDLSERQIELYLPDLTIGDLDSLDDTTRDALLARGVRVARDPDQYSTDLGKAISAARALARLPPTVHEVPRASSSSSGSDVVAWADLARDIAAAARDGDRDGDGGAADVLVFSSLGGRVDHGLGVLSELSRAAAAGAGGGAERFWLVTECSVSWVLDGPGAGEARREHVLHLGGGLLAANVGLLPVFGPASITTRGLEWDVRDWRTEMGGDVSTSNHVVAADGVVGVETTGKVLFTVEMAGALCR